MPEILISWTSLPNHIKHPGQSLYNLITKHCGHDYQTLVDTTYQPRDTISPRNSSKPLQNYHQYYGVHIISFLGHPPPRNPSTNIHTPSRLPRSIKRPSRPPIHTILHPHLHSPHLQSHPQRSTPHILRPQHLQHNVDPLKYQHRRRRRLRGIRTPAPIKRPTARPAP